MSGDVAVVEPPEKKPRLQPSSDEAVANPQDDYGSLLTELAKAKSSDDFGYAGFVVLEAGFANTVCAIERFGKPLVVKSYTDLVFLRIDQQAVGAVDVHAGQFGVGPCVYHSSLNGLVEHRIPGRTLEEADMHRGDHSLLTRVAAAVAALHRLPIPSVCNGEPMLWRTMDKMLDVAAKDLTLLPKEGVPGLDCLRNEMRLARAAVDKHQAKIVLGHNDCKPSNVIATSVESDPAMLIDFELGGPNYRGFDLFKLFRTASGFSEDCLTFFLSRYIEKLDGHSGIEDAGMLLVETKIFEPLTWLEALIFFLTMPHFKPQETPRWHALAVDRWEKYEKTKSVLMPLPPER